ncbi:MAG: hypothetical protein ACXVP8_08450, partial [Actinomycetota bacterium]
MDPRNDDLDDYFPEREAAMKLEPAGARARTAALAFTLTVVAAATLWMLHTPGERNLVVTPAQSASSSTEPSPTPTATALDRVEPTVVPVSYGP